MTKSHSHLSVMSKAGKTFYFASRWLSPDVRLDTATAYHFCRLVDDIADESAHSHIRDESLSQLHESVLRLTPINDITDDIIQLIEKFPEIQSPLLELIMTCKNDIQGTTIKTEEMLLKYAHGVAGTVGLLMYPILGGTAEEGRKAADHLGIAMQCSNIARDVLKDFEQNREYLPSEWLRGQTVKELLTSTKRRDNNQTNLQLLTEAIQKLLHLADIYYESGLAGLRYLQPRNRFAIRVAARCYQAIGQRVLTSRHQIATKRSVVPLHEKCLITLRQARWLRKDYLDPISESSSL